MNARHLGFSELIVDFCKSSKLPTPAW
jgi:hypothetical protein